MRRRPGTTTWAVLGLAVCITLGGCQSGENVPEPSYTPVPDTQLFEQVEDIDGVASADLSYDESFTNGSSYAGEIEVSDEVDAEEVLDRSYAILRQGRPRAAIIVEAFQGDRQITSRDIGLASTTDEGLTQRYGPQPGDGQPPS